MPLILYENNNKYVQVAQCCQCQENAECNSNYSEHIILLSSTKNTEFYLSNISNTTNLLSI